MSPLQYVHHLQMNRAVTLLLTTGLSVQEIGEQTRATERKLFHPPVPQAYGGLRRGRTGRCISRGCRRAPPIQSLATYYKPTFNIDLTLLEPGAIATNSRTRCLGTCSRRPGSWTTNTSR